MSVKNILRKNKYLLPLIIFVFISGLFTVFGDRGLFHLYRLYNERKASAAKNEKVRKENEAFREEIQRLKSDNKYIEMIARKELGMVGKNELVYQFEK